MEVRLPANMKTNYRWKNTDTIRCYRKVNETVGENFKLTGVTSIESTSISSRLLTFWSPVAWNTAVVSAMTNWMLPPVLLFCVLTRENFVPCAHWDLPIEMTLERNVQIHWRGSHEKLHVSPGIKRALNTSTGLMVNYQMNFWPSSFSNCESSTTYPAQLNFVETPAKLALPGSTGCSRCRSKYRDKARVGRWRSAFDL